MTGMRGGGPAAGAGPVCCALWWPLTAALGMLVDGAGAGAGTGGGAAGRGAAGAGGAGAPIMR